MPDAVLAYNRLSITPPSITLQKCYTLVDRSCGLHRRSCCDFLLISNPPITRSRSLEGKDQGPRPYDYQRGDGTRAWVRISGEPILDRDGCIIGVVVGIIDIDREKRAEEVLQLAAAQL